MERPASNYIDTLCPRFLEIAHFPSEMKIHALKSVFIRFIFLCVRIIFYIVNVNLHVLDFKKGMVSEKHRKL